MKLPSKIISIIYLLTSSSILSAEDLSLNTLKHNPFKPPGYIGTSSATTDSRISVGGEQINLRGTLSSARGALINVGGKFYAVDDYIGSYQLISIGDGTAVFMKNGEKLMVSVNQ